MRAEDILADDTSNADFNGVVVRKGTIAAFLANARVWSDPDTGDDERAAAERDIVDALPALRAVGLFDALEPRDERLRRLVSDRSSPSEETTS